MKLQEAIERGADSLKHNTILYTQADKAALALLVKAGERIIAWRNDNDEDLLWDLPGETQE